MGQVCQQIPLLVMQHAERSKALSPEIPRTVAYAEVALLPLASMQLHLCEMQLRQFAQLTPVEERRQEPQAARAQARLLCAWKLAEQPAEQPTET